MVAMRDAMNTLLVVSASQLEHAQLARIVDETGWSVHFAYTGDEAAECLREHAVHVVLCDRDLHASGWNDLMRCMFQMEFPPVLLLSSAAPADAGADISDDSRWADEDVVLKPYEPRAVLSKIGDAFRRWRQEHGIPCNYASETFALELAN